MSFLINPFIYAVGGCSGNLISTSGLTGYWNLNSNTADYSENGRTLTNSNVTWDTGKFLTAAAFVTGSTLVDGSPARKLTTTTQLVETVSTSTSGLSLSCWLKLANLPSQVGFTSIAFVISGAGQRAIWLEYTQAGQWRLIFFDGTTQFSTAWTNTPTLNTWIHVCLVVKPSTGEFNVYFDGVSRISGTNTNNGNAGFTDRLVISSYPTVSRNWLGWVDDFAVFARPLSTAEITTLYESTCPLKS